LAYPTRKEEAAVRVLLLILALAVAPAGCNTIEGAGRDISGAGEVLEDGARKTKRALFD